MFTVPDTVIIVSKSIDSFISSQIARVIFFFFNLLKVIWSIENIKQ